MIDKMCKVGALTSVGSIYSYRSWDFEKVESLDPFDANGSIIIIYSVGSNIYRIGPIASIRNNEWCTDKIRYVMNIFSSVRYYCISFYTDYVSSWSNMLVSARSYLYICKLTILFITISVKLLYSYDKYINSQNFSTLHLLVKLLDFVTINTNKYLSVSSMVLYLQNLKFIKFIISINFIVIIFASFIYYEYLYVFLFFMNKILKLYLVGNIFSIYYDIKNIGLGIISYMYLLLSYYINSISNNTYLLQSLYSYSFNLFISFIINNITYLKIVVHVVLWFKYYSKYLNWIFLVPILGYILTLRYINIIITLVMLYSNFFIELEYIGIFLFSLSIKNIGLLLNIDNINLRSLICPYQISFTPFINILRSSIVVPIYAWLEYKYFYYNYYGLLDISCSILNNLYVCNFKKLIIMLNNLEGSINKCLTIIVRYIDSVVYIFKLFIYNLFNIYKVYLINSSILFTNIISNILYVIVIFHLNFFFIYYILSNSINMILFSYNIYSYIYIYIDEFTYFLTSSMCNISIFLGRYINDAYSKAYIL